MSRYVVNEHGEILQELRDGEELTKLNKGDRVVRSGSIEYLEGTVLIKIPFIKLNYQACDELYEYGNFMFALFKYVDYSTGVLKFNNGRIIRPKHLAGILRRKRRSGNSVISELIEKDVIHKHKDENGVYYTMNPYIILKGKRIVKSLYEEFKNTKYRNIDWEF